MGLIYADIELINGADLILAENGYIEPSKIRKQKIKIWCLYANFTRTSC